MNPEDKQTQKPIKALRTYKGDVEEALGKSKSTAATIMLAEEKRREERPEMSLPKRVESTGRNRTYLLLGTVMLFLAISVVGAVYYMKSTEKVTVKELNKALIEFNQESKVMVASTTRELLLQKIALEKDTFKMPANSILYINTSDSDGNPVSAEKLMSSISKRIPADLSRAFSGKYMIGVYSFDTNATFIILKTNEYETAYSGMLRWEKDLANDIGKIFSIPQNLLGSEVEFIDEEYKNKDLRVLKDSSNKSVLLYTFIDRSTIIITTDENVLSAIMGKYAISQNAR